jgi:hypothetical protein
MNTSLHISSTAREALHLAHVKRALPAMIAIALIAATFVAWYVILDMALSSLR